MKKRLNITYAICFFLTILISVSLTVLITYKNTSANELRDLQDELKLASQMDVETLEKIGTFNNNIRATVVDPSGAVIYDNFSDPSTMENHADRKEIKEALSGDIGKDVRLSNTLNKDTYYYASLMADGNVIRLSKQTESILGSFMKVVPLILLMSILLILVLLLINKKLVDKLLLPIDYAAEHLHRDDFNTAKIDVYDELSPFIRTIERKNKDIKGYIESLETKESTVNEILRNMNEGLVLIDTDLKVVQLNDASKKLFKSNMQTDYTGMDVVRLTRNQEVSTRLNDLIQTHKSSSFEIMVDEDNLKIYLSPIENGNELTGIIMLVLDVNDEKKAEKLRREFSANVSHELKSPLTSISGYAELIKNGMVKEEDIKKFSGIIFDEAGQMLRLIDNIIMISKLDERPQLKSEEEVSIKETIENILKLYKGKIDAKNLTVESHIEDGLKKNVPLGMLSELYRNLISNAIKYNKDGGKLTISVEKRGGQYHKQNFRHRNWP
ncbi:histidine kinase dimerization/phospho-acceptor domain-containing protein [Fenollaria timonensis]|uniref:sensor histidine kinase n=1 Tax=Fenollaria timonensis TaxID=1723384 RepID=UPI0026EC69DA|nr:histidine kinase dimerization/phospho-acceptor domain-containing protein [Fenollaria timonensis]